MPSISDLPKVGQNANPLEVGDSSDPSKIQQRRISASLDGDQMASSTTNAGDTKIFEKATKKLGKQDFLQLLMTQMRYQDPLAPQDNTQMVSQLAQFSALEGTQNVSSSIDELSKKLEILMADKSKTETGISSASATSLLGKQVRVYAKDILFDPNATNPIDINVHADPGKVSLLTILDDKENIVNTKPITQSGEIKAQWDGKKLDGTIAVGGKYHLRVTSPEGVDSGYTYMEDRVTGVNFAKEGMRLEVRGQSIGIDQVVHVGEELPNEAAK